MFLHNISSHYQTVLGKLLKIGDNLPSSSALKVEAADPFEAPVMISQTVWCHIPEGSKLHSHCSESLKSQSLLP